MLLFMNDASRINSPSDLGGLVILSEHAEGYHGINGPCNHSLGLVILSGAGLQV